MKLFDMLKIEGGDQYQILTYLVFNLSGYIRTPQANQ